MAMQRILGRAVRPIALVRPIIIILGRAVRPIALVRLIIIILGRAVRPITLVRPIIILTIILGRAVQPIALVRQQHRCELGVFDLAVTVHIEGRHHYLPLWPICYYSLL